MLEIAGQLNYRPHRGAQAMKTGYSNLIAIAHSGMGIEAAEKANLALSRIIHEKGYDYLAHDMNWFGGCITQPLICLSGRYTILKSHGRIRCLIRK